MYIFFFPYSFSIYLSPLMHYWLSQQDRGLCNASIGRLYSPKDVFTKHLPVTAATQLPNNTTKPCLLSLIISFFFLFLILFTSFSPIGSSPDALPGTPSSFFSLNSSLLHSQMHSLSIYLIQVAGISPSRSLGLAPSSLFCCLSPYSLRSLS